MVKAETTNTLSRRFLVASAATLPALAVPAIATAVTAEPDPIYAAIKACVAAERADAEAMEQFNHAEDRFKAQGIWIHATRRDRHGNSCEDRRGRVRISRPREDLRIPMQ